MQDTGDYSAVRPRNMSRRQLSNWLVDSAKEGSPVLRLTELAFNEDGSFFIQTPENLWAKLLFGCTNAKAQRVLGKVRSGLAVEFSETEIILLEKTFSASYVDPLNVVQKFVSYVEDCERKFRALPGVFFAPYITLVQSSGSGKSRLLREVSNQLCTLYVCCRSGKTGYPLRTSDAINFLFKPLENTKDDNAGLEEMVERLRCADSAARYYLSRAVEFPEFDSSKAEFPSVQLSDRVWSSKSMVDFEVSKISPSDKMVLIVIDEARWLLDSLVSGEWFGASPFRFFRRAIKRYAEKYPDSRLFAVFVDTSSRINNFAPSQDRDPSARPSKEGCGDLFHPFILSETFDAYFHQHRLPKGTLDLSPLLKSTNYLFAGRPLVAIPFNKTDEQLNFLVDKLYGGINARSAENSLGALSVAMCRLGVSFNSLSPAAAEMVAGHMVYLLASDWRGEEISISHLAEPRLALAAAREWNNQHAFVSRLIPALLDALLSGRVSCGVRGELVAQIIILLAFDKACALAGKAPGNVVSLASVLQQLLPMGSDLNIHEAIPCSLHEASVSCGQFVQLDHYFDLNTNVRLAERHCGASFKGCQPGVDAVIPIIADFAALLLFRFKNYDGQDKPCKASYECADAMMPSHALSGRRISDTELSVLDGNCVRVYMQVGAKDGPAYCGHGPWQARGAKPLQIFGLSSRCLSKEVRESLSILLDATGSLESKILQQRSLLKPYKSTHPFSQDIATLRFCMLFVINEEPHWSDNTKEVLLSVCSKLGLERVSKLELEKIVEILEREQQGNFGDRIAGIGPGTLRRISFFRFQER